MGKNVGDPVVLVRGLQGNTWWFCVAPIGRLEILFNSLHVRTFVLAHLFYLVVEGRVLDHLRW